MVFEHKTYHGRIYRDGEHEKWVQYLGGEKNYFCSPVRQNQYHARRLRDFVGNDVPIYTFISHSKCGKWEVRNIPQEAHFLRRKGDFVRIYENFSQWSEFEDMLGTLKAKFAVLSRPTDGTREKHIDNCR